jgi:hypothetical protein
MAIPQAIGRSVRPADEIRTVFAQELTSAPIERDRQVPAEISVRHDCATFIANEQGQNRKPPGIVTELLRSDLARLKVIFVADPELQEAQSVPGRA